MSLSLRNLNNNYVFPASIIAVASIGYAVYSELYRSGKSASTHSLGISDNNLNTNANQVLPPADFYRLALEGVRQCVVTPGYIHQIIHPEIVSVSSNGRIGYVVQNEKMLSKDHFESQFQEIVNFKRNEPTVFKKQMKAVCTSTDPDNKGCALLVDKDRLLIDIPRQKKQNHIAMMDFLRSWVSDIETLSTTEFHEKLKETQRLLFMKMNLDGAGTYRTKNMVVFPDTEEDRDRSFPSLSQLLLKRGGSQKDVEVVREMFQSGGIHYVTEREQKAWSKLAFIPCDHTQVLEKMNTFILELQETIANMKKHGKVDPIYLGSFVHRKIGEIHPFQDGNGRVARALMNAIFMEYEVDPVVFLNDAGYTAAIQKEAELPGHFYDYLLTDVIPKTKQAKTYLNS